ncbi:TonB-dependent receptor [Shewanella eurypsychrophilus]|uniref:TonB-dependent receptor n=1 Tax=Shewanella eurypsychrophilus TaxID=2593656 RepID=A0ABX6VBX4_9GAMM|nr:MULTISPECIES: porin family protein [Shewanella]QFU25015.1 TonB-dependent receptor [Shewanella sp. YLB-09]QPG60191.1 TonB-dependent receptor [Shewanella eurypsychrophilus]
MTKYLIMLVLLATSLQANANMPAEDPNPSFTPKISLTADYIPAAIDMYGITLAPYHHDRDYAQWGYYIGYAKSDKDHADITFPSESYTQDTMWRFGLSYSLTNNFSLYGGASSYNHETHYTSGKTPKIVDGEPIWEEESDTTWGGEVGLRYMMDFGLMISTGYNSASETAVFSLGWAI